MNDVIEKDPDYQSEWTIMVYFAADNDLDEAAFNNLRLMKQAGSNSKVNIIAQIDTRGIGNMVRFRLRDTRTTLEEDVLEVHDEINTGLGSELTRFVNWGVKNFKAERYMLVIWGHGEGWQSAHDAHRAAGRTVDRVTDNDDFSVSINKKGEVRVFLKNKVAKPMNWAKKLKGAFPQVKSTISHLLKEYAEEAQRISEGDFSDKVQNIVKQSLPYTTGLMDRISIAIEDSNLDSEDGSKDVLTNEELKKALKAIRSDSKPFKLDILAMDACLMGMAETAYQVRGTVRYLLASEDTVPLNSWPYDRILSQLVNDPEMTTEGLIEVIIREYLIYYRDYAKGVTLSACKVDVDENSSNESESERLRKAVSELTQTLIGNISQPSVLKSVLAARSLAQSFYLKEFIDLYDFCEQLSTLSGYEKLQCPAMHTVSEQCQAVMKTIYIDREDQEGEAKPVQASTLVYTHGHCGYPVKNAKGVSIYFPLDRYPNEEYENLDFVKLGEGTGWGAFLKALLEEIGIPQSEKKKPPIQELRETETEGSEISTQSRSATAGELADKADKDEEIDFDETDAEDQRFAGALNFGLIKWPDGTPQRVPISSLGFMTMPKDRRRQRNHPYIELLEELDKVERQNQASKRNRQNQESVRKLLTLASEFKPETPASEPDPPTLAIDYKAPTLSSEPKSQTPKKRAKKK